MADTTPGTPSTAVGATPRIDHQTVPTLSHNSAAFKPVPAPAPPPAPAAPPAPAPPQGWRATLDKWIDKTPDWAQRALRSPCKWKTLFRCWLAVWVGFIVILPTKSLQTMGNAAFFAFLSIILITPEYPLALVCYYMGSMLIGMLFAWAFGAAAIKAAVAARSQTLLSSQLQKVNSSIAGYSNPDQLFRIEVFKAAFLDTRASVVFGVFLAVGNLFFALVRAYYPTLIFGSIFGTIVLDVFCTIGPLFPFANYLLLNSVLISCSIGVAIAVVCNIVVWPQSANHMYLGAASDLVGKLAGLLSLHELMLRSDPVELRPEGFILSKLTAARIGLFQYHTAMRFVSDYLNVEISFGRWSGDDVKMLEEKLLTIVARIGAFQSFASASGAMASQLTPVNTQDTVTQAQTPATRDTYLLRQFRNAHAQAAHTHGVRIQDIFPLIHSSTAELRAASAKGLKATQTLMEAVNNSRSWWKPFGRGDEGVAEREREALEEAARELRRCRDEFESVGRLGLVRPYEAVVRSVRTESARRALPMQALLVGYAYASDLLASADAVIEFMETVGETARRRRKSRFWAPTKIRSAIRKLVESRKADEALGDVRGDVAEAEDDEEDDYWVKEHRKDPDAQGPTNPLQWIPFAIHWLYRWSRTAEAAFCFKYVVVSIALWLPAVFKSSAHIYYAEKGVWALIMSQTALNVYAGDQLFNYFTRIGLTVVGLVLGLLAWYIGCQNGNGNPYGIAATVGVILVPVVFFRINSPPRYLGGTIMGGATFALVVGYSWIDGHMQLISNPGVGWDVAWRRWTLVMIGVGASFIVMLFPAKSSRRSVRMQSAALLTSVSRLYSTLMSIWIAGPPKSLTPHTTMTNPRSSATSTTDGAVEEKRPAARTLVTEFDTALRPHFLSSMRQAQMMREMIALAKWEGSLRGHWPSEKYEKILAAESNMLTQLSQVGNALGHISAEWRQNTLTRTGIINPHFITDVMSLFSHVTSSLSTGEPLPEVLPKNLLDRFFYHHHHHHHSSNESEKGKMSDDAEAVDVREGDLPRFSADLLADLQSVDYMHYATALLAILQIIQALDELHSTTKELCGETPMRGFERWRDDYERTHDYV